MFVFPETIDLTSACESVHPHVNESRQVPEQGWLTSAQRMVLRGCSVLQSVRLEVIKGTYKFYMVNINN